MIGRLKIIVVIILGLTICVGISIKYINGMHEKDIKYNVNTLNAKNYIVEQFNYDYKRNIIVKEIISESEKSCLFAVYFEDEPNVDFQTYVYWDSIDGNIKSDYGYTENYKDNKNALYLNNVFKDKTNYIFSLEPKELKGINGYILNLEIIDKNKISDLPEMLNDLCNSEQLEYDFVLRIKYRDESKGLLITDSLYDGQTEDYRKKLDIITNMEELISNSDILIGYSYEGGYGTWMETIPHEIRIYKDQTARIYINTTEVAKTKLTEEQYNNILEYSDYKTMKKSIITCNDEVCDGSSQYLNYYGEDNEAIRSFGGYMAEGDWFIEAEKSIKNNISNEWYNDSIEKYDEWLEEAVILNTEELENKLTDHIADYSRDEIIILLLENGCGIIQDISEPIFDTENKILFKVTDEYGIVFSMKIDFYGNIIDLINENTNQAIVFNEKPR